MTEEEARQALGIPADQEIPPKQMAKWIDAAEALAQAAAHDHDPGGTLARDR